MERKANPYLAYIDYRMANHRARRTSDIFSYFRQSTDHSTLWMTVMRGYYLHRFASFKTCIMSVGCSRITARKIIIDAQAKGYLQIRQATDDRRQKLVIPTKRCIEQFESMVDNYQHLFTGHD